MLRGRRNRVTANVADCVNRRIRLDTDERVAYLALNRDLIPARLRELDREWDIERAIEANASVLAFTGLVLTVTRGLRWLVLPIAVTSFLFQHAIQGWCPPVPILRRLGFRTASEIEEERMALKALRGDFSGMEDAQGAGTRAINAARA